MGRVPGKSFRGQIFGYHASVAAPGGLDEEEGRTWEAFSRAVRLLLCRIEQDVVREAATPTAYCEILLPLSLAPRRCMRMSDLAEATGSKPSRLSHAVSRLEEVGWVRRDLCPTDRRGWFAVLTDEGAAALEAAAPRYVESIRAHLFDHLTRTQMLQLRRISDTLLAHLAPGGEPGSCAEESEVSPTADQPASGGRRRRRDADAARATAGRGRG